MCLLFFKQHHQCTVARKPQLIIEVSIFDVFVFRWLLLNRKYIFFRQAKKRESHKLSEQDEDADEEENFIESIG